VDPAEGFVVVVVVDPDDPLLVVVGCVVVVVWVEVVASGAAVASCFGVVAGFSTASVTGEATASPVGASFVGVPVASSAAVAIGATIAPTAQASARRQRTRGIDLLRMGAPGRGRTTVIKLLVQKLGRIYENSLPRQAGTAPVCESFRR
jgi:hypothetical protein